MMPDARLVDQDGSPFTLSAYRGRAVLVDFIYTRCPTICGVLGDDFANVLQLTKARRLSTPIDLLSIGFDPQNDGQEALRRYGERFGAKAPRWRVAKPIDEHELAGLLQSFGVVVIPDGTGGFIHNDAVYVIDARGRLARILDPDGAAPLVEAAFKVATQ
jgi:protein SCO1/2